MEKDYIEADNGSGFEKIPLGYFKNWHQELVRKLEKENRIRR